MPPSEFFPAASPASARKIDAATGFAHNTKRAVAAEIPVSFVYGDAPYAVMMASPGGEEDFAYGFSLTEGLIRSAAEIRGLKVSGADKGIKLEIELSPGRFREPSSGTSARDFRFPPGTCF